MLNNSKKLFRFAASLFSSLLTLKAIKIATLLLIFLLVLQSVAVHFIYGTASEYLSRRDPRQLQNRSVMTVMSAPVNIQKGSGFAQNEIVEYLYENAYRESTGNEPGTFNKNKRILKINFRQPNVSTNAKLNFEGDRIARIELDGKPSESVEIESVTMQNFVKFVNSEVAKEQRTRRTILEPEALTGPVIDALTSAEDFRFFEHFGIDWFAVAWRALSSGLNDGGSGITQQLIKNNVLKASPNETRWQQFERKAFEIPLALALEKQMNKLEILAAYASTVFLGSSENIQIYGLHDAALEYFGKSASELNLSEAAALSGMICRPSYYLGQIRKGNYMPLRERRNRVLDLIGRNHPEKYSAEEIANAKAEPLEFIFASSKQTERPFEADSLQFSAYAARNLPLDFESLRLEEGNLKLETTINPFLQKSAMNIARTELIDNSPLRKKITAACRKQNPVNVDCAKLMPQIAIMAVDAKGEILSMVGGVNSEFNYATNAYRSTASSYKPFIYLKAIQGGTYQNAPFTAATIIDPEADTAYLADPYRPQYNVGKKGTARQHLLKSWNFGAIAAADSAGLTNALRFAGEMTNTKPEITGMSVIGGTAGTETSLFNMTQAYTLFSAGGNLQTLSPFRKAYLNEQQLNLPHSPSIKVADPASVYIVNDMLGSVVEPGGTAGDFRSLAKLAKETAFSAKTGTGMGGDLWFFGFSPGGVLVGVWVGLPNDEIQLRIADDFSGGNISAHIAARFIREGVTVYRPDLLKPKLTPPENIKLLPINKAKGCLMDNGSTREYFIENRLPLPCSNENH